MTPEEKLAKEDKRIHVVDIFNTGLIMNISKIKSSGHSYFCPTPSIPALYLNISHKSLKSLRVLLQTRYNGAKLNKLFITRPNEYPSCPELRLPEDNAIFYDCIELYFSHVIFSYTALESFANEVIANKYNEEINQNPNNKTQIEKESLVMQRHLLKDKLKNDLPQILNKSALDNQQDLWDKFNKLEEIRHNLIHFKSNYFQKQADSPCLNDFITFITKESSDYTIEVCEIMRYFIPNTRRWLREFPYN